MLASWPMRDGRRKDAQGVRYAVGQINLHMFDLRIRLTRQVRRGCDDQQVAAAASGHLRRSIAPDRLLGTLIRFAAAFVVRLECGRSRAARTATARRFISCRFGCRDALWARTWAAQRPDRPVAAAAGYLRQSPKNDCDRSGQDDQLGPQRTGSRERAVSEHRGRTGQTTLPRKSEGQVNPN